MAISLPTLIFLLICGAVVVVIPLVAILTEHQRKMAELLRQRPTSHDEIRALRQEIAELRLALTEPEKKPVLSPVENESELPATRS